MVLGRQAFLVGFQRQAGLLQWHLGRTIGVFEKAWPEHGQEDAIQEVMSRGLGQSLGHDKRRPKEDYNCGSGKHNLKRENHLTNSKHQLWQV